ncbi:TIM barrel protein [Nocardia australiensis]|uniref:TIM barrel protein n=1 Tax=Nocardia australiensis TaxID=2887191 RepID=UPI001D135DAF|nr:TIM barrel protein [Nocardia australiensis]
MTEPRHPLRIAAAPISWGVCEVPGWGRVLDSHTVLTEMVALGISAMELGPPEYLPRDPVELRSLLDEFGIRAIGGFLALPLHLDARPAIQTARRTAALFAATGAEALILAAATGLDGYDTRPPLVDADWHILIETAAAIRDVAAEYGLRTTLHPHVGTYVETEPEVRRFLADSDLDICLDTGHLLIGGTDPVLLARQYPDRIGHIHLKDVRSTLANEVREGAIEYSEAVRRGLYVPLGAGDVDVEALVRSVHAAGYRGWYVLEQDTALPMDAHSDPDTAVDSDTNPDVAAAWLPSRDALQSLRYLADVGSALTSARI